MSQVENGLFVVSTLLQLAALFYALRMLREVNDHRPWLVLSGALLVMFGARIMTLSIPESARQHVTPYAATLISFLLLVALFSLRQVAAAERLARETADRRTAERDESEKRYRALAEMSPDVMFVSADGKIAFVNHAALRFFGATDPIQILGHSPLEFITADSRPLVDSRIAQLQEIGQTVPAVDEDWLRLDGSVVPVEAAGAVVPWQGGRGIQTILRDVSERKKAETERVRLLANERAARSAAEHASRMKDEFLATVSHELRTPLNAIFGWSQILRQDHSDPAETNEGIEVIERNARSQAKLIDDLLDMSRIISGKVRLDIQRVYPVTAIEAAVDTVRNSAKAKGVRLEQVLDPMAGPISGDPNRLQQIVWNLLSNAIKFTPKAGRVQIVLSRVNSHIEISVADTGEGIRQDFLPYVFDRFRQGDGVTTRKHGGLGLGLSIAKHLVELHGGSISAESPGVGKGTTVLVKLPLMVVDVELTDADRWHPTSSSARTESHATVDLSGLKILVVDDEPDSCKLVQRLLAECKANVVTATCGAAAIPLIESERPDVLVSDIGMPEMDGYELLRHVRALGQNRGGKVPAVALTAFARSEDRTRALMAGYSVHVSKPVEGKELIATVASLAGRTGQC